jgi:DinB family protein
MTSQQRAELVSRYRLGARAFLKTITRLPEESLDRSPDGDAWTPRMIAHHVADAELTAATRLRRLIAEDAPRLVAYDPDEYAHRLHYDRPLQASLALISALTDSTAELLESMSEEEWTRSGVHEESGAYTAETWLAVYAGHCQAHAEQAAGGLS